MSNGQLQLPRTIMPMLILGIVAIIFLSKSTVNIEAGKAGVLWKRFGGGVVTDKPPFGEGFHIVAPWNEVVIYEVRQQELFEKMKVLSSNGLDIILETTAWYMPKYEDLGRLHQEKGETYLDRIIKPALRSAARSVVGRYTPEQLYSSKRDIIQSEIFDEKELILKRVNLVEFVDHAILKIKQESFAA